MPALREKVFYMGERDVMKLLRICAAVPFFLIGLFVMLFAGWIMGRDTFGEIMENVCRDVLGMVDGKRSERPPLMK